LKGAGLPAGQAARLRTLAVLFRTAAAATAVSAALIACGGGGGSAAAPESPPPAPSPAPAPSPSPTGPIAAQMTVPTPVGYDADRLAAFNRLNEIRLSAGLGMLAQSTAMDQAAQAHAEWMVANDSFTHEETAGTDGFTGESWPRRDEAFGYVPVGGSEVIASGGQVTAEVEALVNGIYHRAGILAFEPVDVGIGWSAGNAASVSRPLVIDLTKPSNDAIRGLGQTAQARIHGIAVWPIDGAANVPLRLGLESPNPAPGRDVLTLGLPVSITVDDSRTISATLFTLTDGTTGVAVPTQVLTNQNDANFLIPESFIALIPLSALSPNTTYEVTFSGSTVQFPSGVAETISHIWSFKTGAS
jgi:uncharacterized protein YkwD